MIGTVRREGTRKDRSKTTDEGVERGSRKSILSRWDGQRGSYDRVPRRDPEHGTSEEPFMGKHY